MKESQLRRAYTVALVSHAARLKGNSDMRVKTGVSGAEILETVPASTSVVTQLL